MSILGSNSCSPLPANPDGLISCLLHPDATQRDRQSMVMAPRWQLVLQITTVQLYRRSLQWHHNEWDGISNHQSHDCLLNGLSRRRSRKISKLRITGLCVGNSPVTSEFPTQRASNEENVSIWWRHHVFSLMKWPSLGMIPDSKVHRSKMGPIWGQQDPRGPHVGPMSLAIWDSINPSHLNNYHLRMILTNTCPWMMLSLVVHIDGLVEGRHNSSVIAMEFCILALTHRYKRLVFFHY